ncbi:MAG: hypothetical protein A2Z14_12530 [Chloroflexi bacterium RBG_16_48_8]|nr:MAG: hypothetical protein A2Z14_12530 [Chloroflexi bacterium RBG_16_48_8]
MTQTKRTFLILLIFLATFSMYPATTVTAIGYCDPDGEQSSGAIYRICMPAPGSWNGSLIIYAHGYVPFYEPIQIPDGDLTLPDGTYIPEMLNQLGFAFAVTSYSTNGLAVRAAVDDIRELAEIYASKYGEPNQVYLIGGSEGGLITTLAVEKYPDLFEGGLAGCGPIGDFKLQINFIQDFRVVFNYFFPGVIPGSAVDIPEEVMLGWEDTYKDAVASAIASNKSKTDQLFRVTLAATDWGSQESKLETTMWLIGYNIFATNDAEEKLGGQPFDNRWRLYLGSWNDFRLNRKVKRFQADSAAINELNAYYQTSGKLSSELVTMHTTGDPLIPYWHTALYLGKVTSKGSLAHYIHIPIFRYGHCNFKAYEMLVGLAVLYWKVNGQILPGIEDVITNQQELSTYKQMLEDVGIDQP